MSPRKLIAITSSDDFKRVLRQLVSDLGRVNDQLTLFDALVKAQSSEQYWRGMAQSQAFWSTVLGGLHDGALYGLARAYDQHDDVVSLRTVMELVDAEPPFLQRPGDFDLKQMEVDLASVCHETSRPVKHLMIWRNNFLAHRNPDATLNKGNLSHAFPITWKDFDDLLERGFEMLNRYDSIFFRNTTGRHVHGHADYETVIRTLQADAQRRHDEVQEEIRALTEGKQ